MNIGARLSDNSPCAMVLPPGNSLLRPLLVDMDPLLVTGRFRELVDTVLGDLDPLADADLGADGRPDFVEIVEYPHDRGSDRRQILISWNVIGNRKLGFRHGHHLGDADARRCFQQCRSGHARNR